MKNNMLGVDIGHSLVKVVLVNHGNVVRVASAALPEPALYAGPEEEDRQIASALRNLLQEEKIHPAGAALAIPSDQVIIQTIDMPLMKEEEVRRNLTFEFRGLIDGDPASYVYDFMSLEPPENIPPDAPERMYMVGAAVSTAYIERMRSMLRLAGLSLLTAAPELAAYKSMIRTSGASEGEFCFVDIGGSATEIYLFHGDSYLTSQELAFGLNDIEQWIAENYEISSETARHYVLSNHRNCLKQKEVCRRFESFALDLKQSLEYYRMSSLGSRMKDLWISGGGTVVRPLMREVLGALEGFSVHPGSAFFPELKSLGITSNLYLKAAGIAMHQ